MDKMTIDEKATSIRSENIRQAASKSRAYKGREELIGQLCEECGELVVAAQKLRRVWSETTKISMDEAYMNLAEECADVLNAIEALEHINLIDMECVNRIRAHKAYRWKHRIVDGDWSE